ncbi:uncharacterized protein LOC111566102 isoform X2 [Amphiprion ocellaris]|uniref:uncharacterized protein LOC111566102 isoform X2 n=1 Tax=Amphiprion ocellaris TaxID=80972 RepID=UPI002410DEE3|nr:uncharacterized protein LOC111566102 isoform X2 [Amphiprion ocellaris]
MVLWFCPLSTKEVNTASPCPLLFTLYQTLTMSADKWIFLLAFCFMHASSNGEHLYEDYHEDNQCETQKLKASLGSSVFLPCSLSTSSQNWVTWTHNSEAELAKLFFEGRVKFLDPRHGRVKAFPNQVSEGNFSIRIDELNNSDLGSYRCIQGDYCQKVELLADSTLSEEMRLLIVISVAALSLLSVGGYYFCKGRIGARAPPEGTGRAVVHEQQTGKVLLKLSSFLCSNLQPFPFHGHKPHQPNVRKDKKMSNCFQ